MSKLNSQLVQAILEAVKLFEDVYAPSQSSARKEGVLTVCDRVRSEVDYCQSDREFIERLESSVSSCASRSALYLRNAGTDNEYDYFEEFDYSDASGTVYKRLLAIASQF